MKYRQHAKHIDVILGESDWRLERTVVNCVDRWVEKGAEVFDVNAIFDCLAIRPVNTMSSPNHRVTNLAVNAPETAGNIHKIRQSNCQFSGNFDLLALMIGHAGQLEAVQQPNCCLSIEPCDALNKALCTLQWISTKIESRLALRHSTKQVLVATTSRCSCAARAHWHRRTVDSLMAFFVSLIERH